LCRHMRDNAEQENEYCLFHPTARNRVAWTGFSEAPLVYGIRCKSMAGDGSEP
jgi:hypothetical protein